MKKFLVSAITALTFGATAFLIIPQGTTAQVVVTPIPYCQCAVGKQEVFKLKKNLITNVVVSTTFLGCLTPAQIAALPPLPVTNPTYAEYYQLGCKIIGADH